MLSLSPTTRVYLRAGATDLRGGFEKLYQLARIGFGQDPLAGGQVFAFCNERRTRVKLLFHDSSGLWICTKRPDSGTFAWVDEGPVDPLTAAQLWALVSGLEVRGWRRARRRPEREEEFSKKELASARPSIHILDTFIEVSPSDPSKLHALLLAERQAHAATREDLRTALLERDAAKAKLQALLQRYFGQSSEKLDPRQLQLAWAAVEADLQIQPPPKPQPPPRPRRSPPCVECAGWRICPSSKKS